VVATSSGGGSSYPTNNEVNPTYTGPLSGYNLTDPTNTNAAEAQIEGIVENDVKAQSQPFSVFVSCPQSSPNVYSCTISTAAQKGDTVADDYVDIQVNTADGSMIVNCVDQNGNSAPCAWNF
jgi:hypothetical protein